MKRFFVLMLLLSFTSFTASVFAQAAAACKGLPDHAALREALKKSTGVGDPKANGGLALNMWATVVNRDGTVCAVVFTGTNWDDQWPGSRVISAQKATTANAFSLTACLFPLPTSIRPSNRGGVCSGCRKAIRSTRTPLMEAPPQILESQMTRWSESVSEA